MSNKNNFHDENEANEHWGSWMEVFALKIGVENILDFMERLKPETDDINRLAEIEMSLISLGYMKDYFKRRADDIDEILDNHPAYGNSVRVKEMEVYPLEYPTGFNMPIDMHSGLDMPAGYPHSHNTADWKPDLDLVTNISDMIHGKDNIIPFRYKDTTN
jgi:hypothetical protein